MARPFHSGVSLIGQVLASKPMNDDRVLLRIADFGGWEMEPHPMSSHGMKLYRPYKANRESLNSIKASICLTESFLFPVIPFWEARAESTIPRFVYPATGNLISLRQIGWWRSLLTRDAFRKWWLYNPGQPQMLSMPVILSVYPWMIPVWLPLIGLKARLGRS